ncbi:snRNA-activating protein complex subunit 2 [Puntigrus tetrazona]|uniref:snRNA-activating protein complex subunit 2 n=1 Tax=Puntigrus tetrazona TaxID=1606681 RepID=UPI001C8987FE|nr:snRNA-activating protein complex subunit 2 [Puntigrus tetrazona]
MKPPFRRRAEPSRFVLKGTAEESTVNNRSLCKGWNRKDLQSFLQALKQQQNFEKELDLTEIQKKVPHRSLKEIEDLIMTLKSRVLQRVYLQVQSQKREERKAKVPIELWAELVQKITRPHEKTISSAFDQMLVIAAVEPCGMMHSEPPHPVIQTPAFSGPHPVRSPKTPSRPSASEMSANPSTSARSVASLNQPDSSSNAVELLSQLDKAPSSSPLVPETPETPETLTPRSSQMTRSQSQLQSEVGPTVSSAVLPSVSLNKDSEVQSGLLDHDYPCNPITLKSVVNFDKIYRYLSDIESKTCKSALTSMESAVLLDMLMCLPEELHSLDCKELQHHLLQIYSQLTQPAKMPVSSLNTDREIQQADVADSTPLTQNLRTAVGSAAEPSSESSFTESAKDKKDWATAGTCPLNPLLVPVALLKRQALDSEK